MAEKGRPPPPADVGFHRIRIQAPADRSRANSGRSFDRRGGGGWLCRQADRYEHAAAFQASAKQPSPRPVLLATLRYQYGKRPTIRSSWCFSERDEQGVAQLTWFGGRTASLEPALPMLQSMESWCRSFNASSVTGRTVCRSDRSVQDLAAHPTILAWLRRSGPRPRTDSRRRRCIWHGRAENRPIQRAGDAPGWPGSRSCCSAPTRACARRASRASLYTESVLNEFPLLVRSFGRSVRKRCSGAVGSACNRDACGPLPLSLRHRRWRAPDTDRVLRAFASLVQFHVAHRSACTRRGSARCRDVLALKPRPVDRRNLAAPRYEICAFAPRRRRIWRFRPAARGGLRWSDPNR